VPTKKKEMTLTLDSIESHRAWLIGRGASVHTVRCYSSDLTLFHREMLGTTGTVTMSPKDASFLMTKWMNTGRRVWSAKTTQRRRTALRSWCAYMGKPHLLDDYRAPTAATREAHPIDGGIDAVMKVIESCGSPEHRALIALCGLVGCRVNEAVTVRARDVDRARRMLTIHGKGAKDRIVPVSERAWPYVLVALAQTLTRDDDRLVPLAERTARATITRVGKNAGMKISSHDLRMTFGTAAYAKTKDLRAVQQLLGHSSSKTTELYTGVSGSMMREAADL
jgi:integrase/recombinase XerC